MQTIELQPTHNIDPRIRCTFLFLFPRQPACPKYNTPILLQYMLQHIVEQPQHAFAQIIVFYTIPFLLSSVVLACACIFAFLFFQCLSVSLSPSLAHSLSLCIFFNIPLAFLLGTFSRGHKKKKKTNWQGTSSFEKHRNENKICIIIIKSMHLIVFNRLSLFSGVTWRQGRQWLYAFYISILAWK